ncbi:hypothetical protein L3Q65_42320 [Amycolatopsis sp. FU40]|uniref:hypothetical protein n=1 Tax=Amycolatopsis sp. FU40 TaxID=2914159 RepID=UPI001F259599|nr:hypothetical protein [Amycolatopsis sp. FU40]UKD59931.1 hypothetical protein L3Q65_42320 [Amycolatopsis sp. FU40]
MYFEPEDADEFEAVKALLIRRCAADFGRLDPLVAESALNFRQQSIDGRLGYWTAALVEEFLLSYTPRTLSADPDDAGHVPEDLRLFLRWLHANGLADPTGDPLTDLDAAVTKASSGFLAAMADERNFGVAKFWVTNALRRGLDPTDNAVMERFLDDVRAGKVSYDEQVLEEIATRHLLDGGQPERAVPQLPVALPPDSELAAIAERTPVVARLRGLVDWVGDGRALTSTGQLKLADARELVNLLDTGDEIDPAIGDRIYQTQSSADLHVLAGLVELAKEIRVVRVVKGKLVRVAKNARLLRDSLALWTAAFDALPSPELVTEGNHWAPEHTVLFGDIIDVVLPDVLNTLYGFPLPMPVVRLQETVWLSFVEAVWFADLDETTETEWRKGVGADLRRVFATLADIGAVTLTTGVPDPMFRADLGPDGPVGFPPDTDARLRAALSSGTVELVALTPLATRAVRDRLIAAGRHAPLVGELAGAEPDGLLGLLVEHYSTETAETELAGWLAAHGGREHGLPLLLDAVRRSPFRTRARAMLDVLVQAVPDGAAMLRELRHDQRLGPLAVQLLVDNGELAMESLSDEETLRGMVEQFIHLLEVGGPDEVAAALATIPPDEARGLTANLLACGHPDETGVAELREVFTRRGPGHATVHPLAGVSRSPKNARKKRRG